MTRYAMYAKEFSDSGKISYTHFKAAVSSRVKEADRPALLQEAADNNWTC